MEASHTLCTNAGDGEDSYFNNSLVQKEAMFKAHPIIEKCIEKIVYQRRTFKDGECFRMADFGCSSGPNTLLLAKQVMDTVERTSKEMNHKVPMFQIFLNDLPWNDFNTLFMSLPRFYDELREEKGGEFGPCFIAGMPGNFYGRLFPDCYLDFAHSSYCLHWRSQGMNECSHEDRQILSWKVQVPEGLVSEAGFQLNKDNIYLTKTSQPRVFELYLDLFKKDLTNFVRLRFQEMVPGSQMVLVMMGSDTSGYPGLTTFELLGTALNDMVLEGLIEEATLDRFNMPFYAPTLEQVVQVIEEEGSFNVEQSVVFKVDWDANIGNGAKNNNLSLDRHERGKYVATSIRVVVESLLVSHFGSEIMDQVFERFASKIAEYLEVQKGEHTNIVVSMAKPLG